MNAAGTHAILNPRAGAARFTLERRAPSAELAPFVERYWIIHWDLRGQPPFAQETLPYPCVNLVIGTHRPGVHGVPQARFVAHLDGTGWVVGVKFRPGGFYPFFGRELTELTDRALPIARVFGAAGDELERAVHDAAPGDDDARVARLEAFLRDRRPAVDDDAAAAGRIVDRIQADPSIARVGDLAAQADVPVRSLERLFRTYVGVPPKWVIRRFRVHEAAERVKSGAPPDWSALAHDLGYFDQAHFIHDFKAQTGRTPAEYAALCASAEAR